MISVLLLGHQRPLMFLCSDVSYLPVDLIRRSHRSSVGGYSAISSGVLVFLFLPAVAVHCSRAVSAYTFCREQVLLTFQVPPGQVCASPPAVGISGCGAAGQTRANTCQTEGRVALRAIPFLRSDGVFVGGANRALKYLFHIGAKQRAAIRQQKPLANQHLKEPAF